MRVAMGLRGNVFTGGRRGDLQGQCSGCLWGRLGRSRLADGHGAGVGRSSNGESGLRSWEMRCERGHQMRWAHENSMLRQKAGDSLDLRGSGVAGRRTAKEEEPWMGNSPGRWKVGIWRLVATASRHLSSVSF
jgi:hypothetical protein